MARSVPDLDRECTQTCLFCGHDDGSSKGKGEIRGAVGVKPKGGGQRQPEGLSGIGRKCAVRSPDMKK